MRVDVVVVLKEKHTVADDDHGEQDAEPRHALIGYWPPNLHVNERFLNLEEALRVPVVPIYPRARDQGRCLRMCGHGGAAHVFTSRPCYWGECRFHRYAVGKCHQTTRYGFGSDHTGPVDRNALGWAAPCVLA